MALDWTQMPAGPLTDPTHDDRASLTLAGCLSVSDSARCAAYSRVPKTLEAASASLGGAFVDNLKPAQATATQLTFPSELEVNSVLAAPALLGPFHGAVDPRPAQAEPQ